MKVTVCFGDIRILVPCGSGDLLVKDLIIEATRRYKKASGKEPDSWVAVHHLQTQSGILDPDDCVRDVADDREQILASYEDSGPDPGVPQGGGDGASGSSSVGTGSPDIFRDPTTTEASTTTAGGKKGGIDMSAPPTHIEVTSTTSCPMTGLGLQVRRSSDPNLLASLKAEGSNKRWSAAAPHYAAGGDSPERILMEKAGGNLSPQWEEDDDTAHQLQLQLQQQTQQQLQQQQVLQHGQHMATSAPSGGHQPFARSGRLSMQFLGGESTGYKWMEAAEKLQQQNQHQQPYNSHPQNQHRQQQVDQQQQQQQQPTQQAGTSGHQHHHYQQHATPQHNHHHHQHHQIYSSKSLPRESKRREPLGQAYESIREKDGEMLLIINEYGSPLGLTAIPDNEHGGGLLVQHVEAGSRAERGRLRRGDRILEINSVKLIGLTESKVQEYLRRSLESSELRVRVLRAKDHQQHQNNGGGKVTRRRDSKVAEMIEAEEKLVSGLETKVATVSPTRKPNMAPVGTSLQVANTRKLGRKIEIVLKKGPNGLGFSVTTRDNPAGGHCPIYIKNILQRGAAIEDGRLKHGDRLLEVDGVPMTGKTQTDVVAILRATQPGATVRLVVSRQHEAEDRPINVEEKECTFSTPQKPPPPVLPHSNTNSTTSSSSSLTKQQKQQQRKQEKLSNNLMSSTATSSSTTTHSHSNHVQKSSSARSLFDQHQQHQQQMQQLNESQHFIDAGSESAASSDSLPNGISWHSREVLTLHIPVHDTEKAGLGVSVKGKTNSNSASSSSQTNNNNNNGSSSSNSNSNNIGSNSNSIKFDGDLGIFVKNVIHGGAASRDGRLRMNDQLLSVNGVSLLGQNNAEAMETLRRAMVNNPGKHPGMITLSVARKITRSSSSGDILEHTNSSSNTSENSGATVIYLSPDKKDNRNGGGGGGGGTTCPTDDINRWSNPVLERLTGGVGSTNSAHHHVQQQQQQQQQQPQTHQQPTRRTSRDHLIGSGGGTAPAAAAAPNSNLVSASSGTGLRNESYYKATNETWSPALHMVNAPGNGSVLIEDDTEPMSPSIQGRNHADASICTQSSTASTSNPAGGGAALNFDATYSSQLSLETNNSGIEHFSRDALGRRSISEKHHAALDARETGTYQRNKRIREERERERRIQLTKSAVYGGSVESLTVRIANANAQIPGYKHAKTASSIEAHQHQQQQQLLLTAEARDQVGDLGPSLGLKKSSSLESLQTMVQEIQMSDEPRGGHLALRTPRGRGREDSLRAAVVSEHDTTKPRKTWLLEDGDGEGGFQTQRNGPFQSSLNDGKHKSRAKKPSILRGIGHMFRFGKNRKDGIVPIEVAQHVAPIATTNSYTTGGVGGGGGGISNINSTSSASSSSAAVAAAAAAAAGGNQIPVAALAALERNNKMTPPAYQPPPPLPPANANGVGGNSNSNSHNNNSNNNGGGIHQNDIFNHRYQHYANYDDLHQHQISDANQNSNSTDLNTHNHNNNNNNHNNNNQNNTNDELSESTLECMRQQVIRQRIKVEAESRLHQHYHSQRSARSQDISMHSQANAGNGGIRPMSSYYEYETVQQRVGSLKQNGHSPITVNGHHHHHHQQQQQQQQQQHHHQHPTPQQQQQPYWKSATMNGFSPASLNSSARSRGPFVTQVTIREQSAAASPSTSASVMTQPTYQAVQKMVLQHQHQHQHQQSTSSAGSGGSPYAATTSTSQPHASKV